MKRRQSLWSDLPVELLELIVLKLSFGDIACFKSVCTSWYNAAKGYSSGPFLMLPTSEETNEQSLQFLNVQDEKKVVYTAKNNLETLLDDGRCVGSSHRWLVVLDNFADPWLLNLFSGKEIELPNRETFPHVDSIDELGDEFFKVKYKPRYIKQPYFLAVSVKKFQKTLIEKAILSANPSYDKNYKVIIIYSSRSRLAFCVHEGHKWTVLSNSCNHLDVVWHDNMLYALLEGERVEVWDLTDSVPTKTMSLSPSYPQNIEVGIQFDAIQLYLVASMGEILVIRRYIVDLVNQDGEVVDEADLLSDEDNHPLVCSYRTLKFKIFKLDLVQETLSEVKSLQDQALFVGGNQTISVRTEDFEGLERDSVYFTDNYWDKIDEEYLYGGRDIGIFNLKGGSIEMLCNSERVEPTPFWALPCKFFNSLICLSFYACAFMICLPVISLQLCWLYQIT